MLSHSQLHGIFPALVTPVSADDTIDEQATANLFAWLTKQGVNGVVPLGGTGEYGSLSQQARIRFVELAAQAFGGEIGRAHV